MKPIFFFLFLLPILSFSQELDSVVVYHGNGAFENKIVDLSNQNLDRIPSKAVSFNVEVLILDNNNLTKLPNWIGNLPNLRSLSVRNNNLLEVNDVLSLSEKLEELYLSGNPNLYYLPSLSKCKNLQVIDVVGTKINELPVTIRGNENIGYFKYSTKK